MSYEARIVISLSAAADAEPTNLEIYRKSTELCRIWGDDLLEDAEKAAVNIILRSLFHAEAHPRIVHSNATERGETNFIGANFYKEELFFVPILLGFLVFAKILVLGRQWSILISYYPESPVLWLQNDGGFASVASVVVYL